MPPTLDASGRYPLSLLPPVVLTDTFTRPGDTIAYTALDSINTSTSAPTVRTLTGAARVTGGGGQITKVRLSTDQTANVAVYKVHFYNLATVTASNDNAAFQKLKANLPNKVGEVILGPLLTEGTGSDYASYEDATLSIDFVTAADANLYYLLECIQAFTPANGQKFTLDVTVRQS